MAGIDSPAIQNLFLTKGADIFKRRSKNILNIPWYSDEGLKNAIYDLIGNKTLGEASLLYPNKSMFVPVLNLTKNQMKVYENVTKQDSQKTLLDISLQTSAAMFYFPIRNINNDAIVDGGVREVCPVMTHAIGVKSKLGIDFKDMDVFVICAGNNIKQNKDTYDVINSWSAIDWLSKFIIGDITTSNQCTSKYWGENIGFNSFTWWNPVQIYGNMDDVDEADYMLSQCEMYKEAFLEKWNKFIND